MKCILRVTACIVAVQVFSFLGLRDAVAVSLTLNLVQAQSHILQTGDFSGLPMLSQDVAAPGAPVAGTTDYNPALPSNDTTFQGTITVNVDNLLAPTSIKILSSAADADASGKWLPEVEPYLDLDMDGDFGEFNDDSLTTIGDDPAPAADADWGIRVYHPAFGANIAYGVARDVVYNVTTPAALAVDGSGQFDSTTENFEFATGWFDYWVAPGVGAIRGRSELAGGDDDNATAAMSTFTVTPLGGGASEIKLFIPIDVDSPGDDANFHYAGQFVATLVIPEPTSVALMGLACVLGALARFRSRS